MEIPGLPEVGYASESDEKLEVGAFVRCTVHLMRELVSLPGESDEKAYRYVRCALAFAASLIRTQIWPLQATHLCRFYTQGPTEDWSPINISSDSETSNDEDEEGQTSGVPQRRIVGMPEEDEIAQEDIAYMLEGVNEEGNDRFHSEEGAEGE
uniref:Uncharacterized protein n=1 Tax=Mycena chlorophos TaxID=658473 RepID=A0ABQ0L7D7_MYCCL|nr:predicted protein [Mycena chlorophos]